MSTEIETSVPLEAFPSQERLVEGDPAQALRAQCRLYREFNIIVQSAASWQNRAGWALGRRTCPDIFLLIPTEGRLCLELDHASPQLISPGGFLMLPPNEPHAVGLQEGDAQLRQLAVHFHLKDRYGRSWMSGVKAKTGRFPGDAESWWHTFLELARVLEIDREAGRYFGAASCLHLISHMISSGQEGWVPETPQSHIDPRIAAALERIQSDPPGAWTVEALADTQRLTAVQFRKLFKRATGQSPKRYMVDLQLDRATDMLRTTSLDVKEVAAECGFVHAHHFHTAFKQRMGQTPSTYRRTPAV